MRPLLALALAAGCAMTATAHELRCSLQAPARATAGAPVMLRFTLSNTGRTPVQVLQWNTPFEDGWFSPYVELTRDGVPVPYNGPMVKRAEPSADQYFRLAAGASRSVEVDLALPFDLSVPGRYHVAPRLHLIDVAGAGTVPRPRSRHSGAPLDCNPVDIEVGPPRGRG
ncbi:hypothetical protein [Ideonella sp. BN130291]|uniref:hypothetical protein n=1 Tax=Ideonella sp. BN130291 TaxID=3112940 RepID=UPI002E273981|nr:hypothetical protein [Ideonella sp. BN130291]